jgi:hypothetical protein
MKKLFLLLLLTASMISTGFGQITVDGTLNEASYTTIATRGTSAPSFGPNIDATSIKIAYSPGFVYIGVTAFLDPGNDNALGLMLNFTSTTHPAVVSGAASGTDLIFTPFPPIPNYMHYSLKTGFEVDYMFSLNSGTSTTNCYVNAGKKVGTAAESYLGNILQTGVPVNDVGTTFFASSGVSMAFKRNIGDANAGLEMKIPFSALGLPNSAQLSVQAFAFIVSSNGFFSNITIPGTPTTAQIGGNPNFATIAGGPYYSNSAVVLPVELLNFQAHPLNKIVELTWQTASEKNASHFEVQRSRDGRTFDKIGQVKANGNSAALVNYAFTDDNPLNGVNYYRLRQMDTDGKETLSNIVSVSYNAKTTLQVFPNPATNKLTIIGEINSEYVIFDPLGREILRGPLSDNSTDIDVSNLPSALYFAKVKDASVKFFKQ